MLYCYFNVSKLKRIAKNYSLGGKNSTTLEIKNGKFRINYRHTCIQ